MAFKWSVSHLNQKLLNQKKAQKKRKEIKMILVLLLPLYYVSDGNPKMFADNH